MRTNQPKPPNTLRFETPPVQGSDTVPEENYLRKNQTEGLELEKLKSLKQDRKERKIYADKTFKLISVWMIFIACAFTCIGFKWLQFSDSVVITLLTTTTVEVIGLFAIVATYLFPNNGVKKDK
jgi:hypothetical protein